MYGILWGMRCTNDILTFLHYSTCYTRKPVILTKPFTEHMGLDSIQRILDQFLPIQFTISGQQRSLVHRLETLITLQHGGQFSDIDFWK